MTTKWFVLLGDSRVCGPFSESQIRLGIEHGKVTDEMRIRQGESDWIRVAKVRRLFDSLKTDGLYYRNMAHQVFGPFTSTRLQAMRSANQLPIVYWLRQGLHGTWKLIDRTQGVRTPQVRRPPASMGRLPTKQSRIGSCVPSERKSRPQIPPAPVMKLRGGPWARAVADARLKFEQLFTGSEPFSSN